MGTSTIDQLMKLDRGKLLEVPTKKIRAKRLSALLGNKFYVTIKALPGDQYTELASVSTKKNGDFDAGKARRAQGLIVLAGLVDPDPRNKELMQHFGAETPKDLIEMLFPGGELTDVANEIGRLSGFVDEEEEDDEVEEEVKN